MGVPFSTEDGQLHLTREGGHSARRIVHVTDATGAAVQRTLIERVKDSPNITLFQNHTLVDLITSDKVKGSPSQAKSCVGLYALDEATDEVLTFQAAHTVLATGGAGKVYLYTTNPDTATGDGIAAAWRAGCRVQNMEFIQFHPTCLYHPHAKSFLISEAVRGEGGRLLLPDGTRFMPKHDSRAELAPRDVVARAIDFEMKKGGLDCVFLDISHQPLAFIQEHFPNIYARCLELGIDISRQPIPVVPAAHYTCGGVVADLHGRTDVAGLYAIGEAACSGLHGANRLASNSLLEALVMAHRAAENLPDFLRQAGPVVSIPAWKEGKAHDADEMVVITHNWKEIRQLMWDYVGIARTNKRLQRARSRLRLLLQEVQEFYWNFRVTGDLLELRNLALCAALIVESALQRKESRGLNANADYPNMGKRARDTLIRLKKIGG
jgi:L-aspartate oxidase